jgi:hypothetical protein
MLVSKSLVLSCIKVTTSSKVSLSQPAFDDIASLLEQHLVALMKKTITLALYRHKPKRILPSDVHALAEVSYPAPISVSVIRDAKTIIHGKKVLIKSSAIKAKLLEIIQTDPSMPISYQKIPKTTLQYFKGIAHALTCSIIEKSLSAMKSDSKTRIDSKHIETAIAANMDLFRTFPEKAFQIVTK